MSLELMARMRRVKHSQCTGRQLAAWAKAKIDSLKEKHWPSLQKLTDLQYLWGQVRIPTPGLPA